MATNDPWFPIDLDDTRRTPANGEAPKARDVVSDPLASQEATRHQVVPQQQVAAPLNTNTAPERVPGWERAVVPAIPGYEVLEELGRGGMGVVYKARQISLKRLVALKVIRAADLAGASELARFRTEAEAAGQLQHPNIVQVYEIGEHKGQPYFSLEYVEGGSLANRLRRELPTPRDAALLIRTLAEAIHFAHQKGIVHRDLKPANILIKAVGASQNHEPASPASLSLSPSWLKITDFGLAKQLHDDSGRTGAGTILGSPSYMPPEQAIGQIARIGPRTDVYSLGAILYELLTGRPPFRAATAVETLAQVTTVEPVPPSQLQPKLPRDLETICLKCLQKDPNKRYESAEALAADLRRFYYREPILARPIGAWERGLRWCRRNRAVATLAAGLAVVILLALVGLSWLYLRAEGQRRLAESNAAKARSEERKGAANLAESMKLMANFLAQQGEHAKAEADLRQAIALRCRLAEECPDEPEHHIEQAILQNNLANLLEDTSRSSEAETAYREALAIMEALVKHQPEEQKNHRVLAVCLNNLGNFLTGQCQYSEAEADYRRALSLQEGILKSSPNIAEYHWELGNSYANLGMLLTDADRPEEALPWFEKGITLLRDVLERNGRLSSAQQFLSLAYANRARALVKLNRAAEALPDWEQAILLGDGVNRPRFQAERAQVWAKTGDTSHALTELAALARRQNFNTVTVYEMARLASLCAPSADDEQAAHAVDWLGKIAALNYFRNPSHCQRLHSEPDFKLLRERSDFQTLLKEWPVSGRGP